VTAKKQQSIQMRFPCRLHFSPKQLSGSVSFRLPEQPIPYSFRTIVVSLIWPQPDRL
jgi:hypothetical protein